MRNSWLWGRFFNLREVWQSARSIAMEYGGLPIRRRLAAFATTWLRGVIVSAAAAALLSGCNTSAQQTTAVPGGDVQRGRAAIAKYGCGSCHTIDGIGGAHGLTGPPLTGIGNRLYIGGVLPNTPDNMMRWIRNPKEVDQKTAMPALGVTQQESADITAFLDSTK